MQNLEIVIQEIAKKHGVILGKDDPILLLHTYLEYFLENLTERQDEEQRKIVAALELEQQKWSAESKTRAERIINASLEKARSEAATLCTQAATMLVSKVDAAMSDKLEEISRKQLGVYRLALANMLSAGLLAISGMFLLLLK